MIQKEESKQKGGMLGDAMGLGKTVEVISLLVSKRSTNPDRKITLIIAPVAVIRQWEGELRDKVKPEKQLNTLVYNRRGNDSRTFEDFKHYDVIITSYGIIAQDFKRQVSGLHFSFFSHST
jgi:SNF2 family DNA or RNA helicase